METSTKEKLLKIPLPVFESADSKEELEDWLMANDPFFIEEMEKIKNEESGQGISLDEAAKLWDIK